jgi:hypothetical protein
MASRCAQLGVVIGIILAMILVALGRDKRAISQGSPQTRTASLSRQDDCHVLKDSGLPGYTGWARPSSTLAGSFSIVDAGNTTAYADSDWEIKLSCDACQGLLRHPSSLLVRAYGPAILTGLVRTEGTDRYSVMLHPMQPGQYQLEVVVSYSAGIDFDAFPLLRDQLPPPYFEGYLIKGFPFKLFVLPNEKRAPVSKAPSCNTEQLVFTGGSWANQWKRGSWRVTSTIDENSYDRQNAPVSLAGYQDGQNSIGFTAAYEPNEGCRLVGMNETLKPCTNQRVRIILIGDSVMRLQRDWLVARLDPNKFQVSFVELYGGILLCARVTGPNISTLPVEIRESSSAYAGNMVIVNSGMHDIHRLCGHQFIDERPTYLSQSEMAMPCTELYERALTELLITVRQIPARVRMFQTTHAAWPKYGNYGVAWDPRYGQELPLDAAFVERFNDVAVGLVEQMNLDAPNTGVAIRIEMVDTYWMTLARPDNRETSKSADIGKKLSHPGTEVVAYMVQIWWQAAIQQFCENLSSSRHQP